MPNSFVMMKYPPGRKTRRETYPDGKCIGKRAPLSPGGGPPNVPPTLQRAYRARGQAMSLTNRLAPSPRSRATQRKHSADQDAGQQQQPSGAIQAIHQPADATCGIGDQSLGVIHEYPFCVPGREGPPLQLYIPVVRGGADYIRVAETTLPQNNGQYLNVRRIWSCEYHTRRYNRTFEILRKGGRSSIG